MLRFALFLSVLSSLTLMSSAHADTPALYNCQVIIVAKDIKDGAVDFHFEAVGPSNESHGGKEYEFTSGVHKVVVLSNARWMGLSWWRGQDIITEVLTVRADDRMAHQVLMAYNPKDQEEQASLDCLPKP